MFRKFMPRVALVIAAAAAMATMSNSSFATGGAGKITVYHLNADLAGRGVCVRMNPALPGTGWGCVYYQDHLYKEFQELLLYGYIYGKTCTVLWNTTGYDSHGSISLVECD